MPIAFVNILHWVDLLAYRAILVRGATLTLYNCLRLYYHVLGNGKTDSTMVIIVIDQVVVLDQEHSIVVVVDLLCIKYVGIA